MGADPAMGAPTRLPRTRRATDRLEMLEDPGPCPAWGACAFARPEGAAR